VQTLTSPTKDELRKAVESVQPNIVYFQGRRLPNDEVGSLAWEGGHDLAGLFGSHLPTTYAALLLLVRYIARISLVDCYVDGSVDMIFYWGLKCCAKKGTVAKLREQGV
ncbi:hypothetical protein Tco_1151697, partial [Tanacetum coccineum]